MERCLASQWNSREVYKANDKKQLVTSPLRRTRAVHLIILPRSRKARKDDQMSPFVFLYGFMIFTVVLFFVVL